MALTLARPPSRARPRARRRRRGRRARVALVGQALVVGLPLAHPQDGWDVSMCNGTRPSPEDTRAVRGEMGQLQLQLLVVRGVVRLVPEAELEVEGDGLVLALDSVGVHLHNLNINSLWNNCLVV